MYNEEAVVCNRVFLESKPRYLRQRLLAFV